MTIEGMEKIKDYLFVAYLLPPFDGKNISPFFNLQQYFADRAVDITDQEACTILQQNSGVSFGRLFDQKQGTPANLPSWRLNWCPRRVRSRAILDYKKAKKDHRCDVCCYHPVVRKRSGVKAF